MRKINEEDFKDFTIKGNGWSITLSSFKQIRAEWQGLHVKAILVGNKKDGSDVIIDTN